MVVEFCKERGIDTNLILGHNCKDEGGRKFFKDLLSRKNKKASSVKKAQTPVTNTAQDILDV